MTHVAEYEGERFLYVEEEASNPTNAISNTAEWNELKARIAIVLANRDMAVDPARFRKSHYSHGGVVHLTMKYILQAHTGTVVEES